jgi:two-component system OmpR family sensor kinase
VTRHLRLHTVRRLLFALVAAVATLVLAVGVVGGLSVVDSTRSVEYVADTLGPASTANAAVLQDLTDAETGVRGYVLSGRQVALEPYWAGLSRLPDDERTLRPVGRLEPAMRDLIAAQERAADRWLEVARGRVATTGGPGTYSPGRFARAKHLFDRIRAVNRQIADRLETASVQAQQQARTRLVRTLALVGCMTVLGVLLSVLLGRRITAQVRGPLDRLRTVLNRLAAGDAHARALDSGPEEIRQVARAVNELAEENQRAQEVESEVHRQLRELDNAKSDFVSNVSHELRTPLTSIRGYVELLEDDLGAGMTPEQASMLDVVQRNVSRLHHLVGDLLTLSRVEARSTDVEHVDLGELVAAVVADVAVTAGSKRLAVSLETSARPILVLADHAQLSRAVLNIVGNAVKYTPIGGHVWVRVELEDGHGVVTIADTGMGIPAADLPHLGSRFYRASNAVSSAVAGTGLGLRIVQTILDKHAGTLEVDSIEGHGTTATVRLPSVVPATPAPVG